MSVSAVRFPTSLPIDEALPALLRALQTHTNVVLEAPPGAGKTTRVPLAALSEEWLGERRIIMLEPRRLAARTAAHFMAATLGEPVGQTVGYRVRGESRISGKTRIEVVTDGVLTRMLSADASLEPYGLVLFDEFHERSLQADLGLALVLESQAHLREELRILVMSATLDGTSVAQLLTTGPNPVPVIRSAGRAFPVETFHRPSRGDEKLELAVARVVREAISDGDGDVLVFLPGAGEQRRVAARLTDDVVIGRASAVVHQLHGSMPLAAQTAAIAPAPIGTRKIVLATSVAETSLTIEGVRAVVDAGLSRLPRFDARVGLTRLETVRVSRASADQRRGRAGRVAPGRCYRLWDVHEQHGMVPSTRAEILDADLAPLALELADAGIARATALRWLDVPPAGPFQKARELLAELGALSTGDLTGQITAHGKRMVALPVQPRLAHLLLGAHDAGATRLGAEIAALLEERDILRSDGPRAAGGRGASGPLSGFGSAPCDLRLRVEAVQRGGEHDADGDLLLSDARLDRDATMRVRALAADLAKRIGRPSPRQHGGPLTSADTGALLALAFPDRIAQRRPGSDSRFLLRSGTGAMLPRHDALRDEEFLAVAELDGAPPEYRIVRAAPITRAEIVATFGAQLVREEIVEWHPATRTVRAQRRTMLGAIALEEAPLREADPMAVLDAMLHGISREGIAALPWSEPALRVRERLAFLHAHDASWPDVSDSALMEQVSVWLGPFLSGMRKFTELARVPWVDVLLNMLTWDGRQRLDALAPTHLDVPSGSRVSLDYADPNAPVLAVKLQEVFGWTSTPLLLNGRVPVTMHLLSPAQRPVQVTRDLAGFWQSSYFDVRKELRGRYPRHPWPEDPLSAQATRRAKPRGT